MRSIATATGREVRLDGMLLATAVSPEVAGMIVQALRAYDDTRRVAKHVAQAMRELGNALEVAASGTLAEEGEE